MNRTLVNKGIFIGALVTLSIFIGVVVLQTGIAPGDTLTTDIQANWEWSDEPVLIDGDTELEAASIEGGGGGDGTENSPFILQNYYINFKSDTFPAVHNMEIRNTTKYFVLKDSQFRVQRASFLAITRTGNGVELKNVTHGTLYNVTVLYRPAWGIDVSPNCVDIEITNCTLDCDYMWAGIGISGSDGVALYNNTITAVVKDAFGGIYIDNSVSPPDNIVMLDNSLVNCSVLTLAYHTNMLNHVIDDSNLVNGYPIQYIKSMADTGIADQTVGELFLLECTNYTVENITMAGQGCDYVVGGLGIILVYCSGITITNCRIPAFATGVAVFASTSVVIQNCQFTGGESQLYLYYSFYCIIDSNSFIGAYPYTNDPQEGGGALVLELSSGNNITGNVIDSSTRIGICIKSGSDSNNVLENEILDGDEVGLYIGGDYNIITYNTIAGNIKYGAQLSSDSNDNSIWLNDFFGNAWNDTLYDAQAIDDGYNNLWNDSYGNYWDDFHERYPDATKIDWIWNTPYELDGSAVVSDDEALGRSYDHFI